MRTLASGRQLLAAAFLAVLWLLLPSAEAIRALADEDPRSCLLREADRLFARLAVGIAASEIDPASVDDALIARETDAIPARCADSAGQSSPADVNALRTHMARWSYHLDRKLSEITARGAPD